MQNSEAKDFCSEVEGHSRSAVGNSNLTRISTVSSKMPQSSKNTNLIINEVATAWSPPYVLIVGYKTCFFKKSKFAVAINSFLGKYEKEKLYVTKE